MFIAHKTVFIIRPCTKALYTLVTKSIVAEAANKSATKSTVAHTVDSVAGFGNTSATTWIRQLVAVDFVADTVDFVASVYGAEATRSTLSTKSTELNSTLSNFKL